MKRSAAAVVVETEEEHDELKDRTFEKLARHTSLFYVLKVTLEVIDYDDGVGERALERFVVDPKNQWWLDEHESCTFYLDFDSAYANLPPMASPSVHTRILEYQTLRPVRVECYPNDGIVTVSNASSVVRLVDDSKQKRVQQQLITDMFTRLSLG